jgi:hypothetical protein
MGAGRHGGGYLGEVERHAFGVAARQDEAGPLPSARQIAP